MTTAIGDTRDGVAARLRRLVIGMFGLLMLVGISGVAAIEIATNQNSKLTSGYSPADTAHQQTLTLMLDSETAVRGYLLTRNPSFLAPYRSARGHILPDLDATKAALDGVGVRNLDAAINAERSLANRWLTGYADPIAANRSTIPSTGQQTAAKAVFDQYRAANALVTNKLEDVRARLRTDVSRLHSLAIPLLAVATLLALLVAAVLAYRAATGISRPLRALRSVVGRLDRGDLGAHANEQDGPSEVRALARAVNSVGRRSRAEAAAERDAEQFRARTRLISSGIRRSSNPTQMAEHLVRGLADAFEVDRVWLYVFAGERVPQLLAQWQREPLRPLAPPLEYQIDELRALGSRLWDNAHTIGIDDHRTYEPTPAGRILFGLAQAVGASSSLVVPIGDSGGALGVIWLAMTGHARHWTLTETGVAQFLAADLAHSMTQSHLIQTQAEAVRLLQELDQAKADFIATVSHELRTPLTSITGYLEMLQDGDAGKLPRRAHEMLTVVDRNATRLRNLIEDLLTQTRIDAGRLRLELASVDLASVLGSVYQAMLPQATSDGVQLKLIAPAGCKIEADQQQLEQVFTNLVGNACKFTPAGGQVTVELVPDEDEGVLVEVADTGMGIPEEDFDRLFSRFFRAANATAAALPGTGLGLAIVREIVQRHGGSVDFHSRLGVGSTFSVWLPLHPARE